MKRLTIVLTIALSAWATASGQTLVIDSILHNNLTRYYGYFLPTGYNSNQDYPLVFVLHGGSGTALGTVGFTLMHDVGDTANFITVYPQAYAPSGNGFSWAAGNGTPGDNMNIDDVDFFDKLIDSINTDLSIDLNRVYATGLSNGGFMCQRLACEKSDKITAVASLTSYIDIAQMQTCQPAREIPMMIINGTADPIIPYNGIPGATLSTDSVVAWWANLTGCNPTPTATNLPDSDTTDNSTVTLFEYIDCECDNQVRLYRVNGGGHTWPGVEIPSYEIIAGETNEDIFASAEIWDFFKAHTLLDCSTTGLETIVSSNPISIYPNPVGDILNIKNNTPNVINLTLWDLMGRTILRIEIMDNSIKSINISGFESGLYLLGDGRKISRIVKN